ncbi:MAG: PAS domain S-box protein, partial [Thiohalobacteraceae bacterium]
MSSIPRNSLAPASIVALYAAFAAVWIGTSDWLLPLVAGEAALHAEIGLFKGLLFVATTSVLLFLLLRGGCAVAPEHGASDLPGIAAPRRRSLVLTFTGLILVIPLLSFGIVRLHGPDLQREAYAQLQAVAALKAGQIENWLTERTADSRVLATNTALTSLIGAFLRGEEAHARADVLDLFGRLQEVYGYDEAALLDAEGRLVLGSHSQPPDDLRGLALRAIETNQVLRTELRPHGAGKHHLDWLVPIASVPRAVIVLHIEATDFLFPLVQNWPTPSASAETLLVRPDGDDVLLLHEPRHPGTPFFTDRYPLSDADLPAALAVRTTEARLAQGRDYRGVDVLAATLPIRGTSWHLVAKVDHKEVMGPLRTLVFWVGLVSFFAVTAVVAAVLILWRQQQRAHQLALQVRVADGVRESEARYRGLVANLPGVVYRAVVDGHWRALYISEAVESLTGYAAADLVQDARLSFASLIHPEDLDKVQDALRRFYASSDTVVVEYRIRHRDGRTCWVHDRGHGSYDADGRLQWVDGFMWDISDRKQAEATLRTNQAILKQSQRAASLGDYVFDIGTQSWHGSEVLHDIFGIDADYPRTKDAWLRLVHPQDREMLIAYLHDQVLKKRLPYDREYRIIRRSDGALRWLHTLGRLELGPDGDVVRVFGTIQDITQRKLAEEHLQQQTALLRRILDSIPDLIFVKDVDSVYLGCNPAFEEFAGRKEADQIGKTDFDFFDADSARVYREMDRQIMATGQSRQTEESVTYPDGRKVLLDTLKTPFYGPEGEMLGMVGISRDITARKQAEIDLLQAATVFENTREGVLITDTELQILRVNRSFCELTGYSEDEVLGQTPRLLQSGRHDRAFYVELWNSIRTTDHWQGEIWNRRRNGEIYPELLSISSVRNEAGEVSHYVAVFADISHIKASEKALDFLAHHDALTRLPNRLALLSRLEHGIESMRRSDGRLALLVLDLDRFKDVNDSFGHPAGDEVLQQVAARLSNELRATDTLARLGGDEFIVLLENLSHADDAARVANEIIEAMRAPWQLSNGARVHVGTSVGITLFPDHGDSAETLLQQADAALYRAKAEGRGCFKYYSDELTRAARERIALEGRLRRALADDQLRVYFQPQVDIASGRIFAAEALVRWQDPEHGLIMPRRFIPIAEETGLIGDIGLWVLRATCTQGQAWIAGGLPPITLAVNLAPHQMRHGDIAAAVAEILRDTGFPPERLELELTESALMQREGEA